MGIMFDASGLREAPTNEALDEGIYKVEIQKVENVFSKEKGTPGIEFSLQILENVPQMDGSVSEGRSIRHTLWFSEASRKIGLGQLKTLYRVTGVEVYDETNLDLEELVGKKFSAVVKQEEYKGNTQHRVAAFKPY